MVSCTTTFSCTAHTLTELAWDTCRSEHLSVSSSPHRSFDNVLKAPDRKFSVHLGPFSTCVSVSHPQRRLAGKRVIDSPSKKKEKKSLNPAILCQFFALCGPLWMVSFDSFLGGYKRLMQQKHLQQFLNDSCKCGVKQLREDSRTVPHSLKANRYTCCNNFESRFVTAMAISINSYLMRLSIAFMT